MQAAVRSPRRPGIPVYNRIDLPSLPEGKRHFRALNYCAGKRFDVVNSGDTAEITLYDEIGIWGVSAKAFRQELDRISARRIILRINSPGGDVFDGIAMHNDLRSHQADVTTVVTGLAASAASIVAMAGDTIEMASNAMMMIHNAWVFAAGNKNDLREVADVLDKIDAALAKTYTERTGIPEKDVAGMMSDETWLSATDAVDKGFADSVLGAESGDDAQKAAFDISVFAHPPAALKKRVEAALREAGYSQTESKAAVSKGFQVLRQREAAGRDTPAQRDAAQGISDLCRSLENLAAAVRRG